MGVKQIAIIGSSELSRRLIYYFEDTSFGKVVGMFDDYETKGAIKHERPVLGTLNNIEELYKKGVFDEIAIGIGYKHMKSRKEIYDDLKKAMIPLATFIHPSSHIESSATIKEGAIVLVNCTVDMNARLEENIFLSSSCFISHDVTINAHTYCAPALNIAGGTEVGECCFLGINTTTIDGIKIGMNSKTAAGSVITRDVPSNVLVAGVPAVIKKELA